MKSLHFVLILAFILKGFGLFAQDPQFSQFYASPLYLGPSFAGSSENTRIATNYRDQWPKLPGTFTTYALTVDHYISEYNSGLGLFIMRDDAGKGKITSTNFAANYSYNVHLQRRWYFRPGIKFTYFTRMFDITEVSFPDQLSFDGMIPTSVEEPINKKVNHFDFGFSFLFHNPKYWFGASFDHLIKASPALQSDPEYTSIKYLIYGGAKFPIGRMPFNREGQSIVTSFYFRSQSKYQQLDFGLYYKKDPLLIGLWYRGIPVFTGKPSNDALVAMLGYKYNNFRIGYSYDATISRLITHTGGAHEISLIYEFDVQSLFNRRDFTPIPCPAL